MRRNIKESPIQHEGKAQIKTLARMFPLESKKQKKKVVVSLQNELSISTRDLLSLPSMRHFEQFHIWTRRFVVWENKIKIFFPANSILYEKSVINTKKNYLSSKGRKFKGNKRTITPRLQPVHPNPTTTNKKKDEK